MVAHKPASGGSQSMEVAVVPISSAQFLNIHNVSVELVAAPGANKMVVPHRALYENLPHGTGYIWPGINGVFNVETDLLDVNEGACYLSFLKAQDITAATTHRLALAEISLEESLVYSFAPADVNNQPLVLSTVGNQMTLGNGTGVVTVWYSIVDISA